MRLATILLKIEGVLQIEVFVDKAQSSRRGWARMVKLPDERSGTICADPLDEKERRLKVASEFK